MNIFEYWFLVTSTKLLDISSDIKIGISEILNGTNIIQKTSISVSNLESSWNYLENEEKFLKTTWRILRALNMIHIYTYIYI